MTPEQLHLLDNINKRYNMFTDVPDDDPVFIKFQKSFNYGRNNRLYHYKVTDENGIIYYFYGRNDMHGIITNPVSLVDSISYSGGHYKNYTIKRGDWTYADVQPGKNYYPEIREYWIQKHSDKPQKIKALRVRLGLSQFDLSHLIAELTDTKPVTRGTVSQWEQGISEPSKKRWLAIKRLIKGTEK